MPCVNRREIFAGDEIQMFHLINRCVCRTFFVRDGWQDGPQFLASERMNWRLSGTAGRDFRVDVMGFAGLCNHLYLVAGWHSLNRLCCAATRSSGVNVELSWHVGIQKKVLSGASCACGILPLRATANWRRRMASGGCQSPDVWFKCRKSGH